MKLSKGTVLTMMVVGAALIGCSPKQEQAPVITQPEPEVHKPDTWGPQSPTPAWWNESPPCPDDAKLVGAAPPKGNVLQCRKPDGVNHGFETVWFPNGHEGTLTEYANGLRHGKWLHWLHGRKMIVGEYKDGRKHGTWTYFFDEMTDWDTQSRMKTEQPVVVETYNMGMILTKERKDKAAPEDVSPATPHEGAPPKTEDATVHTGQPAPPEKKK